MPRGPLLAARREALSRLNLEGRGQASRRNRSVARTVSVRTPPAGEEVGIVHRHGHAARVAGMLFTLSVSLLSLTALAAPPITESFRTDTAAGWILEGDAALTSGGADPAGAGWLRLTNAVDWQAGSAIYTTPFSSTEGVQATFTYATYGGTGADGITFYLIDGATASPTVGGLGGALGYSWAGDSGTDGVTGGYVGIGFDECGNFSHWDFGDCNPWCPGSMPNSVTLRGSGNLGTGFNYLTHASHTIETGDRAGAYRVRITIPPGMPLLITVEIDSGSGFVTVIDEYNLTTAPEQAALPTTFKMGFSAGTGGLNNFHEIRDLVVAGANATTTAVTSAPDPSGSGQTACFTATVTPAAATGTVTFLEGTTVLGTGSLSGGTAQFCTDALAVGTHTISARYEGNSTYGGSLGTDPHEVLATAPEIDVQRPADTSIADGGTDAVGNQGVGTVNLSYTIDNTAGTGQLEVTGAAASNYVNSSGFSIVSALPLHVAPGTSGTLDVSFDVASVGPFSFDVAIACNDADEDPYGFDVLGTSKGDVNGDGVTDILDVRLVFAHANGCTTLTGTASAQADINEDGVVDIVDARLLAAIVIEATP